MNRLQSELDRLYLAPARAGAESGAQATTLVSPSGQVRALVMELARPPSWEVLSRVWHGVQTELGLPAPAIAINGLDALQLWFSLAAPVDVARGQVFLEGLRLRFLADVDASRVRLLPASNPLSVGQARHARLVPALQEQTGNWSAFLAPDLVPIFADTPWLDLAPNEEGQAALLQRLAMVEPAAFDEVAGRLAAAAHAMPATDAGAGAGTASVGQQHLAEPPGPSDAGGDPKKFLTRVMNDDAAPLALRIEAAKALLQHANDPPPPR